jgi:lipoprotein signal peptidase
MEETQDNQNQNLPKQKESAVKSSFFFFILVFIFAVVVDQVVKKLAFSKSDQFKNYAFAFSLPLPLWLMYAIYILVLVAMAYYVFANWQKLSFIAKFAWTLIFAGALSNIAERIILGYVRDFVYVHFFQLTGIYNLADFFIIIGIILLVVPFSKFNHRANDL